ncbi:Cyclin-dependent kinase F-4 [Gossypium arboreum]|nr:Cyclin-dependent kinase F-4 [Gossypium arboreum]
MERYKLLREVGDGTFGCVWRAINKLSGEVVAIKKMKKKYCSWEECVNLREVKSLRRMNHPNIVKLKEVIRENNVLYFVFEYMECNLYQLMKDREKHFSEVEIRNWCFQVFQGLAYMHQCGYFHRDLKPENLLVSRDIIKIADFGLAREISSHPPYTEYVSTRWYRAPEILLQSYLYTSKVGKFSVYVGDGCYNGRVVHLTSSFSWCQSVLQLGVIGWLFTGLMLTFHYVCSEADEIYKICSVLGTPTKYTWSDGLNLARSINYQFPKFPGVHLSLLVPSASDDAINLITSLCSWDPCKRPSATEALGHPFFQVSCYYVPPSLRPKAAVSGTPPSVGVKGTWEQQSPRRFSGFLPNAKLAGNHSTLKANASLGTGVQRKLEMVNQDLNKNDKSLKSFAKQPRYRPPGRKSPFATSINKDRNAIGASDVAEKLANVTIGNRRLNVGQIRHSEYKGWGSVDCGF